MSAVVTPPPRSAPPVVGPRPFRLTREQYYTMAELGFFDGVRVELIRGEVVEMPRPSWPHVVGKTRAADRLRQAFAGVGWVNEQNPLPVADSDPQPDVAVYPGRIEDYADHPTGALLVVEVSDSTLAIDMTTKAELYATAGVPDYWVLDLKNRVLHVYRDPVPLPEGLGATAYRTHTIHGPEDAVAPLHAPAADIKVADLLP